MIDKSNIGEQTGGGREGGRELLHLSNLSFIIDQTGTALYRYTFETSALFR